MADPQNVNGAPISYQIYQMMTNSALRQLAGDYLVQSGHLGDNGGQVRSIGIKEMKFDWVASS